MNPTLELILFGGLLFGGVSLVLLYLAAAADPHARELAVERRQTLQEQAIAAYKALAEQQSRYDELLQECQRLQHALTTQPEPPPPAPSPAPATEPTIDLAIATTDWQRQTFATLQTLLTNYPSVREVVKSKPNLPAKNIMALFNPLDNLVQDWDLVAIGEAWQPVPFDPQLHQPDADDIQPGETVYVRFIGYRQGETILCPAKVSRTLPGGSKHAS